jgi:hypothetical protein
MNAELIATPATKLGELVLIPGGAMAGTARSKDATESDGLRPAAAEEPRVGPVR